MSDRLSARDDRTFREELIAAGLLRPGVKEPRAREPAARLLLDDAGRQAAARAIRLADESDAAAFDVREALRARRRAVRAAPEPRR